MDHDPLTERSVLTAAAGTMFAAAVYYHERLASTMDLAAALAERGAPEGTLALAEEQTAGRGRLGRTWHSERGAGLYLSVVLRPGLAATLAPVLTLAAGLGVADAVTAVTGLAADLRWPNDVLLGGRKCCGILPEMASDGSRIRYVVLGIGLNVNGLAFPADLGAEATSLAIAAGRPFARAEVLRRLLHALDARYRQLLLAGPAGAIADFQERSTFALDRRIRVEGEQETYTGITQGLDPSGFLLVRREDTGMIEPVLAGKVRPVEE